MDKYRKWGLWVRIALPILLFVATGSIILCAWLYASAQRESRNLFAAVVRANADFIRHSRLPTSERTATELSRLLDVQVFFRESNGGLVPRLRGEMAALQERTSRLTPSMGIVPLKPASEVIAVPIDATRDLIVIRPAHAFAFPLQPLTLVLLVSFWGLSLVLAWTLTRGVVRPLRILAQRLPQIENEDASLLPGVDRNDEIGLLARTYVRTHAQLVSERQRRETAERFALLGKMATCLAHEINNPLSSIQMHLQLLESARPSEMSAAETIPIILGETSKIESLVNQWMFLARPAPPQMSPVDLRELTGAAIETLQPQAAYARVTIDSNLPEKLRVRVDTRRIAQAIGNIILNAIQAMPAGGTLRIAGKTGPRIRLQFHDTGRGFSETALRHYADPFFSEKEGGMGIGLSVSAEIVKAHGGTIEVTNAKEGGAKVTLALPEDRDHVNDK